MSLAELAKELAGVGWPMAPSAVHKIETGERRADVDDLVAFALALHCTPNALLLPDVRVAKRNGVAGGPVLLTPTLMTLSAPGAWVWATWEAPDPNPHPLITVKRYAELQNHLTEVD